MFGINNAIRSVATGIATSVDSTARTAVGGLALIELAVNRRLDSDYQNTKTESLRLEAIKDLKETAKSVGHSDVLSAIKEADEIFAAIRRK